MPNRSGAPALVLNIYLWVSGALGFSSHRCSSRSSIVSFGIFDELLENFRPEPQETATRGWTNEVVEVVEGIRRKRLGNSGLVVSEVGLGTQRWVSADFNAPQEGECFEIMDRAILEGGVNLIDTAEQYPIPSDRQRPEGTSEATIGKWMKSRGGSAVKDELVIATKVTGGRRVSREGILDAVDGSLRRLGVDHLDLVQTHWPARYSPQSNWGQSLSYRRAGQLQAGEFADCDEVTQTLGELVLSGKIRGYGFCNDNAVGLVGAAEAAKRLGVPGPCVMQNDYSILNRRIEENGVAEASAPWHYNCGFFAYNALAGGVLTGKYLDDPPSWDAAARRRLGLSSSSSSSSGAPPTGAGDAFGSTPGSSSAAAAAAGGGAARERGRFDDAGWGRTLYRYRSQPAEEAARAYLELAQANGLTLRDLSLQWCRTREALTSVLLGVSNVQQLEEGLESFRKHSSSKGAAPPPPPLLSEELLWEIDRVHMRNRLPIFSSTDVGADWFGRGGIGEPIP